ncbi:MAG: TolC family outer membrane protein [Hyphomicrobium sp.]|nr:TolC family outer membrane protein [Hyphomicrobium sp.]
MSAFVLTVAMSAAAAAQTIDDALAQAYEYNPQIDAERARLRGTDEEVARAMSGYRPVITGQAEVSRTNTNVRPDSAGEGTNNPRSYAINLTQPIFRGFRTTNAVNVAEAEVRAGRERLRDIEQQVLLDAATQFMNVVRDQAVVRLNENNVRVLSEELKAQEDRFAVGDVTKTDVAQSEARRAGAVADLDLARANLKSSRAEYERVVGSPPAALVEPSLREASLPRSLDEAIEIGTQENPNIVAALYNEQAARFQVDLIRGELLPELSVEAQYTDTMDPSLFVREQEVGSVTGRMTVPIYEGGEVYARVRQAKHLHVGRLQDIETARVAIKSQVIGSWSQYQAQKARIVSAKAQVEANSTALSGVREEERVGQRTVIEVLNAQQELLFSQVELARTRRDLIVAAYTVQSTIGRLDAQSLGVTSLVYDPEQHYYEVRRKWWGLSITHDDGRREFLDLWNSHGSQVEMK